MHVDTNSHKLKVGLKIFWVGMVKNRCGQSGHVTLKFDSQFWQDARSCYEVLTDRVGVFGKPIFFRKLGNRPKIGFYGFKEKFGHYFHWIFFMMKIYIICFVPAQILYRQKSCS